MRIFILLIAFLYSFPVAAQETDIIPYLRSIEEGKLQEVILKLADLKKNHPSDPSVMFLEAVVTENAEDALPIFHNILNKYPRSKYADASLYRIYSYHFASGLYNSAEQNLKRLKEEYPESPYIKIADRDIPDQDEQTVVTDNDKVDEEELNPGSLYKYTIQAGAFSNKKNSSALANQFRSAGYDSEVKEKFVAGTSFDVVYVGKFKNEIEARDFLKKINERYNLDGRIVEINNAN